MGRLLPLLFIANLALIAVAMVDCLGSEPRRARVLPRWLWILLILLVSPVGPVAWLAVGRPEPMVVPGRRTNPARRAPGPDDDAEFLRGLSDRRLRPQDEELLRRLETEFGTPEERGGPDRPRHGPGGQPDADPDESRRHHPSGKDIDNDRDGDPTET